MSSSKGRSRAERRVGRVAGLWRFPVKSMGAEALERAEVGWHGLPGDRRWAFVRKDMIESGFPWLTIREQPELWRYQPRFTDPQRPDKSRTVVRTPGGAELDVTSPALATELGAGARVIRNDRGFFDAMPLSLVTTQTIAALGETAGLALDVRRFRPNLVVEAAGDEPFREDSWVGRELQLGAMRLRVDRRDIRCIMVNVDPTTTRRNAAVLRAIARDRKGCLGVYASVVAPGAVAVGDPVTLLP